MKALLVYPEFPDTFWSFRHALSFEGKLSAFPPLGLLTVSALAQRVAMSPRNFARVFTNEMKTTPAKFVERLRIEAARRRLEESPHSMETIASECGFGNVNSMRNVFQRTLKIPPGQYRRHFRHAKKARSKHK